MVEEGILVLALLLADEVKKDGYEIEICSSYRTFQEQDRLYRKGRSKKGRRVTNVRGGYSHHNWYAAVDFRLKNPVFENGRWTKYPKRHLVWSLIGKHAEKMDLIWGGSWRMRDYGHIQLPVNLKDVWRIYRTDGMRGALMAVSLKAKSQFENIKRSLVKPAEVLFNIGDIMTPAGFTNPKTIPVVGKFNRNKSWRDLI